MLIEYVHPMLGQEIQGRAGYSVPLEEGIMEYKGRAVLYILGYACVDRSCCSKDANWGYIQVPGYLLARNARDQGADTAVSQVEIIEDEGDRAQIRQHLIQKHPGAQIEIWGIQYRQ